MVRISASPVSSRGSQDVAWVRPRFRLRFRCSERHTAVCTSKRLSARISSVAWNTLRLLINDWHAVCEAGLLNSRVVPPSSKGQPGQQRPRHVYKRAGRDGHLVARCCRVPSCFCPMCHFGRSIVCEWWRASCVLPRGACMLLWVHALPQPRLSRFCWPQSVQFSIPRRLTGYNKIKRERGSSGYPSARTLVQEPV